MRPELGRISLFWTKMSIEYTFSSYNNKHCLCFRRFYAIISFEWAIMHKPFYCGRNCDEGRVFLADYAYQA